MQHENFLRRIHASGDDAISFLQGQLTQDLRAVQADQPRWAGYCSPKGRLLAVMRLYKTADGVDLELHHSVAAETLKRLKMFVMRSKVTLTESAVESPISESERRLQNIQQGIPVVFAETRDHFVPQMVNLDLIGGISLTKGCYTGQEIVARLHYLGNLKRRMFLLRSDGPAPSPGTDILLKGETQAVGEVVDALPAAEGGCVMSAVLQISHAESAALHLADGSALSVPQAYSNGVSQPPDPVSDKP